MSNEIEKIEEIAEVEETAEMLESADVEETKEESLEELLERVNQEQVPGEAFDSFTISSIIGKDDYRYFLYHSVLFKHNWVFATYIGLPIFLSLTMIFFEGGFNLINFILSVLILYVFMFGMIVIRTEMSLRKIGKKSPEVLRLTDTVFQFTSKGINHSKNGNTVNVPYKTLAIVSPGKKRIVLYFTSRKAMVIRNEDIEKVMPVSEFVSLLRSKITARV